MFEFEMRCVRRAALLTLCLTSLGLGCGDDGGSSNNDADSTVTCGEGTELQDGACVVSEQPCPTGQVRRDDSCQPVDEVCGDGTIYDTMEARCVPADTVVCGPNTEQVDGECRPVDDLCEAGTVRDPDTGGCVVAPDACDSNTIFDPDSRRCVPSADVCDDGTYFDDSMQRCRPGRAVYGNCSNFEQLDATLTSDTVLPVGECYRVEDTLSVVNDAQLTIEAGVVIVFEEGSRLRIDSGKLVTNGQPDRPVYLTGRDETPGHWAGLQVFNSGVDAVSLTHTVIDWAGQADGPIPQAAVVLQDNSTMTANHLDVVGSGGYGIYALEGDLVDMRSVTLADNIDADLATNATRLGAFDADSSFESGPPIEVLRAGLTSRVSWKVPAVYSFGRSLDIADGASFSAAPGSTLLFPSTRYLNVDGELELVGTELEPIVIEGTTATAGSWRGVVLDSATGSNTLEHVVVRHAGRDGTASIFVERSDISLGHVTVELGSARGVWLDSADVTQTGPITVESHPDAAIYVSPSSVADLTEPLSLGSSVVEVLGGSISEDARWDVGVPLVMTDIVTVDAGSTLELVPGSTLLFELDAGLSMDTGALSAVGTSSEPIEFRATQAGTGNWRGLYFNDSRSPDNALEYVLIAEGGGAGEWSFRGPNGNLTLQQNAQVRLNNVTTRDSGGPGISVIQGATATDCTGVVIQDDPAVVGTSTTLAALCGQ